MTPDLSSLFVLWAIVAFLGLWAIWPPVAVAAAGIGGMALTVAVFLGRRRGGTA